MDTNKRFSVNSDDYHIYSAGSEYDINKIEMMNQYNSIGSVSNRHSELCRSVSDQGLLEAIINVKKPKNAIELGSLRGLVNVFSRSDPTIKTKYFTD